jgi:hypothetical protein
MRRKRKTEPATKLPILHIPFLKTRLAKMILAATVVDVRVGGMTTNPGKGGVLAVDIMDGAVVVDIEALLLGAGGQDEEDALVITIIGSIIEAGAGALDSVVTLTVPLVLRPVKVGQHTESLLENGARSWASDGAIGDKNWEREWKNGPVKWEGGWRGT